MPNPKFSRSVSTSIRTLKNSRLLKSFAGVAAGTLIVRFSQVVRELVFAYEFGINHRLDLLLLVLALPTYLGQSLLNAVPAAVIPAAIAESRQAGSTAMVQLISSFSRMLIVALVLLSVVSTATGPLYFSVVGHGLNGADLETGMTLLVLLSPFLILRGMEVVLTACLNVKGQFLWPSLIPCLTPLLVSVGLAIVGPQLGVHAVAAFTSSGLGIECAVLWLMARKHGAYAGLGWYGFSPSLQLVSKQYIPVFVGSLLAGGVVLVDQRTAAQVGQGAISQVYFANLIVQLPLLLASTALSTGLLPHISEAAAGWEWRRVKRLLILFSASSFALGLLAAAVVSFLSVFLVSIVLVRGAFRASAASDVANVVSILAWQIPFFLVGQVAVQVVSALRQNEILLWVAVISISTKIVLNETLVPLFGLPGIGLSTTVVQALAMVFLLVSCALRLRRG